MWFFPPRLFRKRSSQEQYRVIRRQPLHSPPRLEGLEDRELLDAYGFQTPAGAPNTGSYTVGANWTDLATGLVGTVPGAEDTADIPSGAVCTLDGAEDQALSSLSIEGSMTIKSTLAVQPGTMQGSGVGDTNVNMSGTLDVATPDVPGTTSKLDTSILNTVPSLGTTPTLSIDENAEAEIGSSAVIAGVTSITGLFNAKNIDAFSGAQVTLLGPGSIGGTGQMEAGINAGITFAGGLWTILPGNPAGSALKEGNIFVAVPIAVDTHLMPDADIFLDPGGAIGGTGDLEIGRDFFWRGGTLGPAGGTVLDASGEMQVSGGASKELASNFTNVSSFDTLGGAGGLTIDSGVTFLDAAGKVEVTLPSITSIGSGVFNVGGLGTLDFQSPSSGPTTVTGNFTSTGTVEVDNGDAAVLSGGSVDNLDGALQLEGDLTLDGAIASPTRFLERAGGGKLEIGDGTTVSSLTLGGGETSVMDGNIEATASGTLTGAGALSNSGVLTLDIGSSTAGLGGYQQTSTGELDLHASSPSTYSSLTVSGNAQLAGILKLEFDGGYMPASGDSFTVVTAGSIGAHFDSIPANMTASYGPTSATLTQN